VTAGGPQGQTLLDVFISVSGEAVRPLVPTLEGFTLGVAVPGLERGSEVSPRWAVRGVGVPRGGLQPYDHHEPMYRPIVEDPRARPTADDTRGPDRELPLGPDD
jgi:hypothetical protein